MIRRAASVVPAFRAAADLHLVEASPVLRAAQARADFYNIAAAAAEGEEVIVETKAGPIIIRAASTEKPKPPPSSPEA